MILRSKLAAAKSFKKWVTPEVLPSFCKTGVYELESIKNKLMLIDQELDKAIKQPTLKDAAFALMNDSSSSLSESRLQSVSSFFPLKLSLLVN